MREHPMKYYVIMALAVVLLFVITALFMTIPGAALLWAVDFIYDTSYLTLTNALVVGLILAVIKSVV